MPHLRRPGRAQRQQEGALTLSLSLPLPLPLALALALTLPLPLPLPLPLSLTLLTKKALVGLPRSDAESVTQQPASEALAEEADAAAAMLKAAANAALLLEYGNEARPAGSKTAYTTFVRVLRKGKAGSDIKRVSFNINPSFDRPSETVDRPNDQKLGFAFEYAMAREYPCFMSVEFAEGPPLTIEYWVRSPNDGSRRVARRLAIAPASRKAKRKGLTVDATEGARSMWVE